MLEFTYYGSGKDGSQKVTVTVKLETTFEIDGDRLKRVYDPKIQDSMAKLTELVLDAYWDCI